MAEKSQEARIKAEKNRLTKIYKNIESTKKQVALGLIENAAKQRIMVEDLWKDLQENGYTELFKQSDKFPPYERKRPAAELYGTTSAQYGKTLKQLTDLLPKENAAAKAEACDGFDDFVISRDD